MSTLRSSNEGIELAIISSTISFTSVPRTTELSVAESLTDPVATELVRNESILAPVDGGFGAWSFVRMVSRSR